ncbi:hypothetical protein A2716_04270 [candidate division WWE3 bacterium RIFCSPHIGHO2_01_FULL_40_23]|uniref:SpoVT-AbrB domain-containing protein n=1 Tax=candidate division WWE3 bacterium RIFCSPLOWO2_01_FULL_41_18 TaxID=1802625 RepID=A0A1F4VDR8_UNCKA|nr:MAG: hypothetical protein A2716_04270 [candidate division WWE3 bacterium RIFCSPHIGHO2_01_FULL_40_23]OGC55090.1 MAG: hypothetical protein A3A78_03880 [candidate division WWE3 bacterium RIFCSPLOWO2_01_FULL_41_18]
MITQKLYKNGNSVAVTIPKEILREMNLSAGSEVMLEKDLESDVLTIAPVKLSKKGDTAINPKFIKIAQEFTKKYDSLLKRLAEE